MHYDEDSISPPIVLMITIHIVLTLILMMNWYAILIDIKGAFLHGTFEKG